MGDLDIYFGRWEIWVEIKMGELSEKKLGDGRFGEKKWENGRLRPPHRGPHRCGWCFVLMCAGQNCLFLFNSAIFSL